MRFAKVAFPLLFAALVAAAPAAAATPTDPSQRVIEVGGSNMGVCSSYLGRLPGLGSPNARSEVNHIIQTNGDQYGLSSPGDLYRVRAQMRVDPSLTPAQECVQR